MTELWQCPICFSADGYPMYIGCPHSICNNCLPNIKDCPLCRKPIVSKNVPNLDFGNHLGKEPPSSPPKQSEISPQQVLEQEVLEQAIQMSIQQQQELPAPQNIFVLNYTSHKIRKYVPLIVSLPFILLIIGLIDWGFEQCCITPMLEKDHTTPAVFFILAVICFNIFIILCSEILLFFCLMNCCCRQKMMAFIGYYNGLIVVAMSNMLDCRRLSNEHRLFAFYLQ